jgi:hypothetical protein
VTGSGLSRLQPGKHSRSGSMHGAMSRSSYVTISLRSSHMPSVRTAPTRDTSNCGELDKLHIPCTQDEGPVPGRAFVLCTKAADGTELILTFADSDVPSFGFCVVHSSALLGIRSYNTSHHKRAQHHAAMIWCYLRGICWFRLLQGGLWGNR